MLKISCFISAVVILTTASGRPADSLRYYRLKGVDVTIGGATVATGEKSGVNVLESITPDQYIERYNFDNARLNSEDAFHYPVRIGLGIIFGNDQRNSRYFVNKHEVMFKFSFETRQTANRYENIKVPLNPNQDFEESARFNYTYQTQTVGIGYQLSTKAFLKNFALFGGANADFGMVSFKQIKDLRYYNTYLDISEVPTFNTTLSRANAMLGLKFNFSCDLNFFIQAEGGLLHYGKGIDTMASYAGASFGIRYKFLEDQDKLKYKNEGFW